jgi:hypothetical protein
MESLKSSWDEIGAGPQTLPAEDNGIAPLFTALFATPQGQRVLEAIEARTVAKPCLQQAFGDGVTTAICMAIRDGENNIYRWIKSQIKKGQGEVK